MDISKMYMCYLTNWGGCKVIDIALNLASGKVTRLIAVPLVSKLVWPHKAFFPVSDMDTGPKVGQWFLRSYVLLK